MKREYLINELNSIEIEIDSIYEEREVDAEQAYSKLPELKKRILNLRLEDYHDSQTWESLAKVSIRYMQLS